MLNFSENSQIFSSWINRLKISFLVLVFVGILSPVKAQVTPETQQPENRNSRVRIQFDLDRRGRPENLEILQSSGNNQFDRATLKAIEKMRFEPSDNTRTGISADIDIEFSGLNAYVYPPELVENFIEGCGKDEDSESYGFCACMIEKVQKKYPLETFLEVSLDMSNGNNSPQVKELFQYVLSSCITEVPIEQFLPSNELEGDR